MTETLIRLAGVTKTFGRGNATFTALRGVDLEIAAGDFVAIVGPSGSGKSTLMNILGCLDVPSTGSFLFQDIAVERLTNDQRATLRRTHLGFVFQGFNLLGRTSAIENVELPLIYRSMGSRQRRATALRALEKVGLTDWADHTPAELSGGQQQRVAIARAIVTRPRLLLADEPTGNLDSRRAVEVMKLLTKLNQVNGITILLVTHEADMAAFARKIVHVRDGLIERVEDIGDAAV